MERRPLVVVSGKIQELPLGDTVPGTSGEEEMMYSKRVDFIDSNTLYKGEAQVGSLESNTAWRIRKITIAVDGDVSELWASGTANFDKQWTNRASYQYS
jgi:hypothetical protein